MVCRQAGGWKRCHAARELKCHLLWKPGRAFHHAPSATIQLSMVDILRYFHFTVWLCVGSSQLSWLQKPLKYSWTRAATDVFQKHRWSFFLFHIVFVEMPRRRGSVESTWVRKLWSPGVIFVQKTSADSCCLCSVCRHIWAHVALRARGTMSHDSEPNCNFTHKITHYSADSGS